MPKSKSVSQYLGIARGAFKKALLSVLLQKFSEKDAFTIALEKFGKECIYCGDKNAILQPDLLWPAEIGGHLIPGNVVPACPSCNSERGNKNWKEYIMQSKRVTSKRTENQIEELILRISEYMKSNNQENEPKLSETITEEETRIMDDVNILLNAITQGLRAKIDMPQEKNVMFRNCGDMFDDLRRTANKYLISPHH